MANEGSFVVDDRTLLHWVRYCRGNKGTIDSTVYEALQENEIWRQMQENEPLLERLQELLELHVEIKNLQSQMVVAAKPRSYLRPYNFNRRRVIASKLKELKPKRQKAYETYEMLRKLCFADDSGNVFKIIVDA